MPHRPSGRPRQTRRKTSKPDNRYTVGLPTALATEVERYAEKVDTSMSKAIASLVRLGLESQAARKREFLERMKQNLDDPGATDRLVDEFRDIILGR